MKPCRAIVHVEYIVYEMLPDGQIHPKRIDYVEDIKIVGNGTLEECIEKNRDFKKEVDKLWPKC